MGFVQDQGGAECGRDHRRSAWPSAWSLACSSPPGWCGVRR